MSRQLCSNRAVGFVPHWAIIGSSYPVGKYFFCEEKNTIESMKELKPTTKTTIDSLTPRNFNLLKAILNDNAMHGDFSWSFSQQAIPPLLSLLISLSSSLNTEAKRFTRMQRNFSFNSVKPSFLSDGKDSDGFNFEKSNGQSMVRKRMIVGRGVKYYRIYGKTHAIPNEFLIIAQRRNAIRNALDNSYKLRERKNRLFQGCSFCKKLGKINYKEHSQKNAPDGGVTCPVLRAYICPICRNANPDEAHAIHHCPLFRQQLVNYIEYVCSRLTGRNVPIRPSNALPRQYIRVDDATLYRF